MQQNNYKIIITGASGFIGTNLLQLFLDKGYEVLNIDIAEPKKELHKKYWLCLNILKYNELEKVFIEFNPDYIVHLAAKTDLLGSTLEDYSVNTTGTENICNILTKMKNKVKKVIFTSTMLVCRVGYIPDSESDYCPSTLYGRSKVIGEEIIKKYSLELPPWAIVRPTSIWGPWFGNPYKDFFDMVLSGTFIFPKNKSCHKTYGYVENIVYQIYQILLNNSISDNTHVFYLGDEPPIHVATWADEIAIISGRSKNIDIPYFILFFAAIFGDLLKIIGIKFPMNTFRLKNMTTDNILPLDKTFNVCGRPIYNRKEGIERTLNWMKNTSK